MFRDTQLNRWQTYFISGLVSGTLCLSVYVPFEVCKIRAQTSEDKFMSYRKAVPMIYKHQGFKGFYQGSTAQFWRDALPFGLYFWSYETTKHLLGVTQENHNKVITMQRISDKDPETMSYLAKIMVAGAVAGEFAWLISFPFDTIKTIIQQDYSQKISIKQAYRRVVTAHGYRGLYNGLSSAMIRASYVNAVLFLVLEVSQCYLKEVVGL